MKESNTQEKLKRQEEFSEDVKDILSKMPN